VEILEGGETDRLHTAYLWAKSHGRVRPVSFDKAARLAVQAVDHMIKPGLVLPSKMLGEG